MYESGMGAYGVRVRDDDFWETVHMATLLELYLARRGLTAESYDDLDDGRHGALLRADEMVRRLRGIHDSGEHIVVLPDYDMDGICSGVIGLAGLSQLGFNVSLFIPDPSKGYGFGEGEVDRLVREHPGVAHVITCDTGVREGPGCRRLAELGIDVLVTDHHMEDPDDNVRQWASVVVDPCCYDDPYRLKGICGAHVLWQVLAMYARAYGDAHDREAIMRLRVFAGMGTVSDVMPLEHENRQLVRDSVSISRLCWANGSTWYLSTFSECCQFYRSAMYGVHCVMAALSDARKLSSPQDIDEELFAFYVAPCFNSVKRLGLPMRMAFDVFFGTEQMSAAREIVKTNESRKRLERDTMRVIKGSDQRLAPFVYVLKDAKPGVLGLLAGSLQRLHNMPCVVVNKREDGSWSGSGRSPEWYRFYTRTRAVGFDPRGHEVAFGFSCKDDAELFRLYAFLKEDVERVREETRLARERGELPPAQPDYDFVIDDSGRGDTPIDTDAFEEFIEACDDFRPFGKGFEPPKALLRFKLAESDIRKLGKDRSHVKFVLREGFEVICFGQASVVDAGLPETVNVIGSLGINEFRGERHVQMQGDIETGGLS